MDAFFAGCFFAGRFFAGLANATVGADSFDLDWVTFLMARACLATCFFAFVRKAAA